MGATEQKWVSFENASAGLGPTAAGEALGANKAYIDTLTVRGYGATSVADRLDTALLNVTGDGPVAVTVVGQAANLSFFEQGGGQSLLNSAGNALRNAYVTTDLTSSVEGGDQWTLGLNATGPIASGLDSRISTNEGNWSAFQGAAGTGPTGAGQALTGLDTRVASTESWQATAGAAATVGGLDARVTTLEAAGGLDARVTDLEDAVVVGANSVDLRSPSTTGLVGFQDSTGTRQVYMTEEFNSTVIVNPTLQARGNLQVYDATYSPIRLVFGVVNNTATATFSDPATNSAYVTLTGGTKTLRVHPGATLDCDGSATFASTITSSWSSSFRQGTATTTTSTSDTQCTTGFTYREHTKSVDFSYTFASAPRVYVNLSTQSASIVRVSATNVTTTGFTLRCLDVDAPTYLEVQWLAVL
jgi:hypothetical protein